MTVLISGLYIAFISMRGLPLSEGWYSVYARSINHGLAPYRDFELLFTPLYAYIVTFITRIFGYSLFVLRIVGALLFVSLAAAMYYIFDRLFNPLVAMVAATTSAMFMQSEVVFIAYDYIRWYDLFTFIAVLTLVGCWFSMNSDLRRRAYMGAAVSGLFSGLAFLTRQNSGLIYIAYTVLVFLFISRFINRRGLVFKSLGTYIAAAALPAMAQMAILNASGSLAQYTSMTTSGAIRAKGGIMAILFSWIGRLAPTLIANRWELTAILACVALACSVYMAFPAPRASKNAGSQRLTLGLAFSALTIAGMYVLFNVTRLSRFLSTSFSNGNAADVLYAVVLVIFVVSIVMLIRKRAVVADPGAVWLMGFAVLQGAVLAIGYGSGTSGGLSQGETALALGVVVALLFKLVEGRHRNLPTLALLLACVFFAMTYMSVKDVTPYVWWGMKLEPIERLTQTLDVPYLEHIRVSAREKKIIEGVHNALSANLGPTDQMFTFPHDPLFYLTEDRIPFTKSYVQWFDVASDQTIDSDIAKIEMTMPRAIVIIEVPEFVMSSHETLFREGGISGLRRMQQFLLSYTADNAYRKIARYKVNDGYMITVWIRSTSAAGAQK